jgi:hypothetical protein
MQAWSTTRKGTQKMPVYEIGEDYLIGDEYYDDEDDLDALLGAAIPANRMRQALARRPPPRGMPPRGYPGQARRPVDPYKAAQAAALAARSMEGKSLLREAMPTKSREWVLGFDSVVTIAAGAAATITQRPQVIFRPERLVIPGTIAPSFLVTDLRIGKNSQLLSAGALPAEVFSQNAFGVRLKMDTAQVAMDIVIVIQNISAGAVRFTVAMIGEAVE